MNPLSKLFQILAKGAANEKNSAETKKRCEDNSLQPKIDITENEQAAMPEHITASSEKSEEKTVITVQQEEEKNESDPLKNIQFEAPNILTPLLFIPEPQEIHSIQLSSDEAVKAGYSFRKRSKSVKITGFHGKAPQKLIIPCCIDSLPVEEICSGVFSEAALREVYIPGSVRKLGIGAFKRSTVTKVVFGDGLSSISENTFSNCCELEQAVLPTTLRHIGKGAFCGCTKLLHIAFPKKVSQIEDGAFSYSGLESFGVEVERNHITNSKAFYHTPMYRNYDIISTSMLSNELKVLYAGNDKPLKLTADRIRFLPYSLDHKFCLNLTECKNISFNRMAVPRTSSLSVQNGYTLKLPTDSRKDFTTFFPDYVEIYDSLGKKITHDIFRAYDPYDPEYYDEWEIPEDKSYNYDIHSSCLPQYGIRTEHKKIYIDCYDIAENAIDSSSVEEIEFYMFNPEGCVFTKNCINIRKASWGDGMSWGKGRTTITKYLPPFKLVDKYLKTALLNAFSSCSGPYGRSRIPGVPGHRRTAFNREVIDSIFRERKVCARDNPYIKRAVPPWFGEDRTITVSNKFKALVAVDVLQSDKMPHESDTKMYSDFLKSHRSFCHKYFEKISNEFPEYAAALKKIEQEYCNL